MIQVGAFWNMALIRRFILNTKQFLRHLYVRRWKKRIWILKVFLSVSEVTDCNTTPCAKPQSDSCVVVWSILRCYYVVWLLSNNTEPCQVLLVLMPCSSTADISLKLQTNCQPEWHQPHKLFLFGIIEILFLDLLSDIHIKGNLQRS